MFLDAKILNHYSRHGLISLLNKGLRKLRRHLFHTTCSGWYEYKLDSIIKPATTDLYIQSSFLIDNKNELLQWIESNMKSFPWIYSRKEIDTAQKYKHPYFMLKHGETIIGYLKFGVGPTYLEDFSSTVVFEPGTAFIYDSLIVPEYRGMGLAFYAMNKAAIYFRQQGFERILCHIEPWNIPAIKFTKKAGFKIIGTIRFVRVAMFTFFIFNGFRPFLNLEKKLKIDKNQLSC